jgi:hypothetical protein
MACQDEARGEFLGERFESAVICRDASGAQDGDPHDSEFYRVEILNNA